MTDLNKKVKDALNEARILVLGGEILLGFQLHGPFRDAFEKVSPPARWLDGGALLLMVVALAVLVASAARHRLTLDGQDSEELVSFTGAMTAVALAPIAASLAIDFFIAGERLAGRRLGIAMAAGAAVVTAFFWYGIGLLNRGRGRKERTMRQHGRTDVSQRIDHMLTEARVVLPGGQALLGFQLAIVLTEGFEKLPASSKLLHGVSLGLVGLAIVLLIAPSAYHRIVYRGEDTEAFHRFGSAVITMAMAPLGLAIAGDVYVVIEKITQSTPVGIAAGALAFTAFAALWFVWPLIARRRRSAARP